MLKTIVAIAISAALAGCNVLVGLEDLVFQESGGGDAGGAGSGAETSSLGGGGSDGCEPGAIAGCYEGPAWNAGIGACALGAHECLPDGSGFGPCEGSVPASYEGCDAGLDANCDADLACTGLPLAGAGFGGSGFDRATALGVTASGDIILGGTFEGSIAIGALDHQSRGQRDLFVARLDGRGTPLDSVALGSLGEDLLTAIAVDAAGGIFVGGMYSAADATDGLRLDAETKLSAPPEGGSDGDAFLLKLQPSLDVAWARGAGYSSRDIVNDISLGPTGDVTLVATCNVDCRFTSDPGALDDEYAGESWSLQTFDGDGALLARKNLAASISAFEPDFFVARADEGVVLATWLDGAIDLAVPGAPPVTVESLDRESGLVARFDDNGVPVGQSVTFYALLDASYGTVRVTDVVSTPGGVYVAGYFAGDNLVFSNMNRAGSGDIDGFLVKLSDVGGTLLPAWVVVMGGAGNQLATGVATDRDGNVIVVGHFEGQMDVGPRALSSRQGGSDVFVIKLEADSTILWTRSFGDASDQLGGKAEALATGHVAIAGSHFGSVDVPNATLQSAGKSDALAIILAP